MVFNISSLQTTHSALLQRVPLWEYFHRIIGDICFRNKSTGFVYELIFSSSLGKLNKLSKFFFLYL